jgi:hypothetical protein
MRRSHLFARLGCHSLEPRETPAAINFGAGFSADGLPGGLPAGYATGELLLTDGPHQAAAVWAPTPVDVRAFQTSFVFQPGVDDPATNGAKGDGLTFALVAAPPPAAGAAGAGLGYAGIADSVAVKFDLVDNAGEGLDSVGVFTSGASPTMPAANLDGSGVFLHSGHPLRADLAYDGAVLAVTLTDTVTPDRVWTGAFPVDIPAALGANTGYAGFTAGTGDLFARQTVRSWTYLETAADAGPAITSLTARHGSDIYSIGLKATVSDTAGAGGLSYTWEVVSVSPSGYSQVYPSSADPSAATAFVTGPGVYTFRLTVRDADGETASDEVTFNNDPRYITSLELTPAMATVPAGGTVQFTAVVRDQYGDPMPDVHPDLSVFGPGSITQSGLYTAPSDVSGYVSIQAQTVVGPSRYQMFIFKYATVQILSAQPPDPGLDFSGGFAGSNLINNGSAQVVGDRLRLTEGPFQAGSAYAAAPVNVGEFTARFEFQVGDAPDGRLGDGLALVFQNAGPNALGAAGGGLGYAGIEKSVALKFDLVDNAGEGAESVGLYLNGAAPTTPAQPLPGGVIHLHSGHVFRVDLRYVGGVLNYMVWDTVTGSGAGNSFSVDLPAAVGGPTAYVGFTAGTGELFAPIDILDWRYLPTDNWDPPPLPG